MSPGIEFRLRINPCRLSAAVRLRLEIIQSANLPTFAHEKIDNVRADQTRGAGNECAFHWCRGVCVKRLLGSALGTSAATTKSFGRRAPALQFLLRNQPCQELACTWSNAFVPLFTK